MGDGLVRLVHQAVLDHWKNAADWLNRHRTFLEREAAMRIEARDWDNKGRKRVAYRGKELEEKIADSAELLATYLRAWSFGEEAVHSQDLSLRAFCIALFERATSPCTPVRSVGKNRRSYVHYAAAYGLIGLLKQFVALDRSCVTGFTSIETDARSPLQAAAWSHPKAVQFLLDRGADPAAKSKNGWPAMIAPIRMGRIDIFRSLMEAAKKRSNGQGLEQALLCPSRRTLVHLAAEFNRAEMLRELLDRYGFSASSVDEDGLTPIQWAAWEGALAAFDFLRERCGIEDQTERTKYTCLHLAAIGGRGRVVGRILELPDGPKLLNVRDDNGLTALHHAAYARHAECIAALLRSGLDPNQPTAEGHTVIHLALHNVPSERTSSSGQDFDEEKAIAALRALLTDERTDPNVEDPRGRRPLALAKKNGPLLRELLKNDRVDLRQHISNDGDTGIWLAARAGVWNAVQRFIRDYGFPAGTEIDGDGNTFLHHLIAPTAPRDLFYDKIDEITKDALNARNKRNQTPFARALVAKSWFLAGRILETGLLDLHAGDNALDWEFLIALQNGAPAALLKSLAGALGERLAEPDCNGWTLLHHVAAANDPRWSETFATVAPLAELWIIPDTHGRRPADLAGRCIASIVPRNLKPTQWPDPIGWDHGVGWAVVAESDAHKFISSIDRAGLDAEDWEMSRGVLPFYPNKSIARLKCRINGETKPAYYYLEDGEKPHWLNGTSPPIHKFNASHLKLTPDSVRNYLHFFCFFVRGDKGPFFILEDPKLATLSPATTKEDREKIANVAMPAWLIGERRGGFRLLAKIFYGNDLFISYLTVSETGEVEMEDDHAALVDLSGHIDMPIA